MDLFRMFLNGEIACVKDKNDPKYEEFLSKLDEEGILWASGDVPGARYAYQQMEYLLHIAENNRLYHDPPYYLEEIDKKAYTASEIVLSKNEPVDFSDLFTL